MAIAPLKRIPPQQQQEPGRESRMAPRPQYIRDGYQGSDRLKGKVALITGGDSGIGRSVAVHFAREGADVAIIYLAEREERDDAEETRRLVEREGRRCVVIAGDVGDPAFCERAVEQTVRELGRLDVLVNNAAEQHPREDFLEISPEQLERTFRTNILAYFHMARAAIPRLRPGAAIINTTSITAYRGSGHLIDYASTKGAIVAFTRSLAESLMEKGIRVNGVAPGPIWTPLIPSTFSPEQVAEFGKQVPMGRAGQPAEVAPSYVFLACEDASYMSGQVLHPNGGAVINA